MYLGGRVPIALLDARTDGPAADHRDPRRRSCHHVAGSSRTPTDSTECAAGTDTASLNNFIANEVADLVGFDTTRVIALPDGRYVWTSAGRVHLRNARRPLLISAPTDRVRPQRAHRARRALLHDASRSCHTRSPMQRQRRVVCRRRDDGDVQPLVLADERRPRSTRPADDLLRRDGQRVRIWCSATGAPGRRVGCPIRRGHVRSDLLRARAGIGRRRGLRLGRRIRRRRSATCSAGRTISSTCPTRPRRLRRSCSSPECRSGGSICSRRTGAVAHGSPTGPAPFRSTPTPNGTANPMQPRLIDGMWISVVKADDWNGTAVRVDVAAAPQGPWTTLANRDRSDPHSRRAHQHVRRHSCMPWRSDTGNLVVALSNNAWQMDPLAFDNPTLYQPRLFELTAPPGLPSPQIAPTTEPLGFVPTSPPIRAIDTREGVAAGARARCCASAWRGWSPPVRAPQ